jgi:hypothetical protein
VINAYLLKDKSLCSEVIDKAVRKGCEAMNHTQYTDAILDAESLNINPRGFEDAYTNSVNLIRLFWNSGDFDLLYDQYLTGNLKDKMSREDFARFMNVIRKYFHIDAIDYDFNNLKKDYLSTSKSRDVIFIDVDYTKSWRTWDATINYNETDKRWKIDSQSMFKYADYAAICADIVEDSSLTSQCRKDIKSLNLS